jgi:hypothetical protein
MLIKIADSIDTSANDAIEICIELYGFILLSEVNHEFLRAQCLKTKKDAGSWRLSKVKDGRIYSAVGDKRDDEKIYFIKPAQEVSKH